MGHGARSVVACRARKDQKAQLLCLIRESVPTSCCLAIGDGANDVAMIKAGHIGVGIIGKEGMQAVNNSDFAIGQVRPRTPPRATARPPSAERAPANTRCRRVRRRTRAAAVRPPPRNLPIQPPS